MHNKFKGSFDVGSLVTKICLRENIESQVNYGSRILHCSNISSIYSVCKRMIALGS